MGRHFWEQARISKENNKLSTVSMDTIQRAQRILQMKMEKKNDDTKISQKGIS